MFEISALTAAGTKASCAWIIRRMERMSPASNSLLAGLRRSVIEAAAVRDGRVGDNAAGEEAGLLRAAALARA